MRMTGNTILVTGGASGIGRALAEAFHNRGNQVIIAGRRQGALDAVAAANPGMAAMGLDIADAAAIPRFAAALCERFPALDAVLNNAGIMRPEDVTQGDTGTAEATIATNLLGPIRLTAALLPHLLKQPRATVLTVSSGLAFVPLAATPAYSATKAAIHAWSMAIRHQLRNTAVQVIELAPPYVQTELLGAHQATDPAAMPLADYIGETMALLAAHPDAAEAIVERCKPLRFAAENGNFAATFQALNNRPH